MKINKLILGVVLWFFCHAGLCVAQRIVVLYAAASPILKSLGIDKEVVGVTRRDPLFPQAVKVGSHLRPNVELIKALHPDIIIAGSRRAFPEPLRKQVHAKVFHYDPRSLEEILKNIEALGRLLARKKEAARLISRLKQELSEITPPSCRPKVIYEIMERPLRVAGQKNIVTDIIRVAGGVNPVKISKKHVLLSPEEVLLLQPDIYLYQRGPMNKNPTPPKQRAYFHGLQAKIMEVDEFAFARPGLNAFQAVCKLNQILHAFCEQRPLGSRIQRSK